jgi:hypothetical protein
MTNIFRNIQKLQDQQKPFIAQTLSRLFIKQCKFLEAEEWATKAIGLKELHTFFDTRGQVHKAELKDALEDPALDWKNIDQCLDIAVKAVKDFQSAERLLKESRKNPTKRKRQDLDLG